MARALSAASPESTVSFCFTLANGYPADAVVVYGEVIAFDTPEKVRADPRVQEAYLGSVVAAQQAGEGH